MSQNYDRNDWLGPLIGMVLGALLLVLIGLWLVSAWLTRLLFEYVLDPLTDGLFARNDGLLIIASALLWAALFLLLLFPQVVAGLEAAQPADIWQAFIGTLLLGLAWGISIGVKVLFDLWLSLEARQQPVYESAQMLSEPVKLVSPATTDEPTALPSQAELERDIFADLFEPQKEGNTVA